MMKKILGVLLLSASLILPNISHAASVPDEQWAPALENLPAGTQGYLAQESAFLSTQNSFYANIIALDGQHVDTVTACASSSAPGCEFITKQTMTAVLPMCASASDKDCIVEVTAKDDSGKNLTVSNNGMYPLRRTEDFAADPSINLPAGSGASLFTIPEATHAGGNQYLVKITLSGSRDHGQKFENLQLRSSIFAVKTLTGNYSDLKLGTEVAGYDSINRITMRSWGPNGGVMPNRECVVTSLTECALPYALPKNVKFGYTLRLSNPIVGWLHGRLRAPEISLTSNANSTELTVSASPVQVPTVEVSAPVDELSPALKDIYSTHQWVGSGILYPLGTEQGGAYGPDDLISGRAKNIGYRHQLTFFNTEAMQEFVAWLPLMKDKASAMPTMWTLNTMFNYGQGDDTVSKCLTQTKSLAGVVTTNSIMYLDGPPTYDKSQGSLDYKVASTHYEADGTTVFKGTYDLVMSSKVARCIYNFTSAPINATISVTSESGEPNVATTIVGEKNGWLSLGAYNFTFSNPTVQVKLTQAAPAPAKITPKKITCVKGKTTKVVTTAMCPTGFKKK